MWFYEGEAPAHARERRLPTGGAGLVVNLRDDRCSVRSDAGEPRDYPGVVVSGPFTRPFVLDAAQQCETMGVEFKIGGAASLLGLPLDELRDLHVPLAELWSSHATELRERALAAPSPSGKLVAVEQGCRSGWRRSPIGRIPLPPGPPPASLPPRSVVALRSSARLSGCRAAASSRSSGRT